MNKQIFSVVAVFAVGLACASAFAMEQSLEERGKAHFNNPMFAGGQKACNDCHPNGRNLQKAGAKTRFTIMGREQDTLEEAINMCITYAIKGKAIPEDSNEMKEMVSYIKSLGVKGASGEGM